MNLTPQQTIMISGAVLIVIGVVIVIFQMVVQVTRPKIKFASRKVQAAGPFKTKATLQTTFPGLIIMFLGVVLELVGYLATAPWK